MYTLSQLEKKQVGLRLPKYLVSEVDEMAERFSINRTDIITEALRTYLQEQKAELFYESLEQSCKEAAGLLKGAAEPSSLDRLIDELETDSDT
jgi:metal-responsive CopG/Arc/MetJ family transcriptional regulator